MLCLLHVRNKSVVGPEADTCVCVCAVWTFVCTNVHVREELSGLLHKCKTFLRTALALKWSRMETVQTMDRRRMNTESLKLAEYKRPE